MQSYMSAMNMSLSSSGYTHHVDPSPPFDVRVSVDDEVHRTGLNSSCIEELSYQKGLIEIRDLHVAVRVKRMRIGIS